MDCEDSETPRTVMEIKSIQDQYFKWLATHVSPAQLSELYVSYIDIENFCLSRKIIKKKLFALTDIGDVRKVLDTVESNKVFRFTYKKNLSKMRSAILFYYRFIKENNELLDLSTSGNSSGEITHKEQRSTETTSSPIKQNEMPATVASDSAINSIDFNNIQSLSFTQPTEFSYFDEIHAQVSSWLQLYVQVVYWLLEDYPHVLHSYINRSIDGVRYDFADAFGMLHMTAPEKVQENFYLETNISATDVARKIKKLLDLCNVDYENLVVHYQQQNNATTFSNAALKDDSTPCISDMKNDMPMAKSSDADQKRRYEEILAERFAEDGYQLGSLIFQRRFKKYYAEKYGCDLEEPDERIDKIMRMVGTKRDDRIFPQRSSTQNGLIEKIVQDILDAFASGMTAVYVEAVYEKYRQPLAKDLRVHNQEELESMLLDLAYGRYAIRHIRQDSVLINNGSNVDSQGDLLRIMERFYEPQNCAAIHEKAWFLPFGRMKSMLSKLKSVVNVAAETYFYAPNLPVSKEDLVRLASLINEELNQHHYMTDVRMQSLIAEKFPCIAIDTEGFTDYGLLNCLGYLLQEQFAFNSCIITRKGEDSSRAEVFEEYARDHKILTVDELEELSRETGTVIYWEAVLRQMIRVSETKLVRKDQIAFDIKATDAVLEKLCPGDYAPLREVNLFLQFPPIGFQWNSYVLESYLFNYSREFSLAHSSFAKTGVFGAMVRRSANLDYRSVLVDALSKSDALASADTALQYIVDKGYQNRLSNKDIQTILKEAKLRKEQRKQQEK